MPVAMDRRVLNHGLGINPFWEATRVLNLEMSAGLADHRIARQCVVAMSNCVDDSLTKYPIWVVRDLQVTRPDAESPNSTRGGNLQHELFQHAKNGRRGNDPTFVVRCPRRRSEVDDLMLWQGLLDLLLPPEHKETTNRKADISPDCSQSTYGTK